MLSTYREIDNLAGKPLTIKKELAALYLDYRNNFLTIGAFAAYYFDGCETTAACAIAAGKAYLKHLNTITEGLVK